MTIGDFARENALKLASADEHLDPDCSFTLTQPGRRFSYVELDNSTELLTAPTQRDSWLKRFRFY